MALVAPKPLQLMNPPAPGAARAASAPPAAPAVSEAAPAVAPKSQSSAAKKPAARRDVRPAAAPPVAARTSEVAPSPAPAAVASAPAVAAASFADAIEAEAAARVQEGNYREAGELFEAAVKNGGKATFMVVHDHSKGNFEKDPKASCVGELVVTTTDIKFNGVGAGESHHFEASWAEVIEAGSNKFFGSGIGGFHVAINPDGKYKNINLAPRSKDKAEAKMIIDLLNASARGKTDRGSK
jgi:hypothetical protein